MAIQPRRGSVSSYVGVTCWMIVPLLATRVVLDFKNASQPLPALVQSGARERLFFSRDKETSGSGGMLQGRPVIVALPFRVVMSRDIREGAPLKTIPFRALNGQNTPQNSNTATRGMSALMSLLYLPNRPAQMDHKRGKLHVHRDPACSSPM